jgi:hypothetical protein
MTPRRLLAPYLVFAALFLATRLPVLLSSRNIFRGAEERARGAWFFSVPRLFYN